MVLKESRNNILLKEITFGCQLALKTKKPKYQILRQVLELFIGRVGKHSRRVL